MRIGQYVKTSMLAATILLASLSGINPARAIAIEPVNLAANGAFEETNTSPWVISGTTSAISIQAKDNHTEGGTHSAAYWSSSSFHFTISQTIEGLPDGRYRLSAWTQGGGGENVSRLFAKDYGGEQLNADFTHTGYAQWKQSQLTHINIEVTNGTCIIGFEIQGNAENWGSFDDVTFTRIGDTESTSVPLDINPIQISTIIHAAPQLPTVVKAVYRDDHSYKTTPVTWETVTEVTYAQTGQFQVVGVVQGSDVPVVATVTVTLKSADLNDDQVVNVADLAMVVYYLQASVGTANWDVAAKADINNDDLVDIADLQRLVEQMVRK